MVILLFLIQFIAVKWTSLNIPQCGLIWSQILPPLFTALFMVSMYFSRKYELNALALAAYIWLGFVFIWFVVVMAVMLAQLFLLPFKINIPCAGLGALALSLLITVLSVINALSAPKIKTIELIAKNLGTEEARVIQLSDMHLGSGVSPRRVEKLVEQINELNPDIIVFTGDIFEDSGKNDARYIAALKKLRAKYGKFGVFGNHEHYRGIKNNAEKWRLAGIEFIANGYIDAAAMRIIGVDDIKSARLSADSFAALLDKAARTPRYKLLLSHTPLYFEEAAKSGIDLTLCGHTHRGQIWPFVYFVKLQFKHIYGLYKIKGSNFYVTSGTFYWGPPMRLLTENEVPLFIIKNEK